MRAKILTALALAWLLGFCCRPAYPATLVEAIRQVESAGNDMAVGDGGASCGPLQCSRAAWADSIAYGKVDWSYDTWVWDRARSAQVFAWYAARYRCTTDESKSRLWNSGPNWRRKLRATDEYWRRVQQAMKGKP